MLSVHDRDRLNALVGKPGIYIERGRFATGQLAAFKEEGELLTIRIDITGDSFPIELSSTTYEVGPLAVAAFGYISWSWIHADDVMREIEARIAATGAGTEKERYRLARQFMSEMRRGAGPNGSPGS